MATETATARKRIAQLMAEAGTAGDLETVELCRLALRREAIRDDHSRQAWSRCIEILEEAKAADDDCADTTQKKEGK